MGDDGRQRDGVGDAGLLELCGRGLANPDKHVMLRGLWTPLKARAGPSDGSETS
jgi:hypothetical protein